MESFSRWAAAGMDYIKVDGFWPDWGKMDRAIQQMDALIRVFAAWHKASPQLVIGYTSGSNSSPFWLQHCDYVWRGGTDDDHAGTGDPFDRYHTFVDDCLQLHRDSEMPISGFVTFDIVQGRTRSSSREAFERGAWWLAARTSLHHDWYVEAGDLTTQQWKLLAQAAKWAKAHEKVFRFGRMIGGDPRKGEVYGFAAFDAGAGTLALRNPSGQVAASKADWPTCWTCPRRSAPRLSTARRLRSDRGSGRAAAGLRYVADRPACFRRDRS